MGKIRFSVFVSVFFLFTVAALADVPTYNEDYASPEILGYNIEGQSVCVAFIIREQVVSRQSSFGDLYDLDREEWVTRTKHVVFEQRKFSPDQAVAEGYWRDKNSIDRKAYLFLEPDMCIDNGLDGIKYHLFPSSSLYDTTFLHLSADGDCDPGENVCDDYDTSNFYERWPATPLPREKDDEDSDDSGGCNTTSDDTSKFLSALMLLIGVLALALGSRRRAAPRD